MAKRENNERNRTSARGVKAADQTAESCCHGRYGGAVFLGTVHLRSDLHMQGSNSWQTLATKPIDPPIDLAALPGTLEMPKVASHRIPTQIATAPGR